MRRSTLAALSLFAVAPFANALTVDFGNGPTAPSICTASSDGSGPLGSCADWSWISQSYGDVAGVVDVTYSNANDTRETLRWWGSDYNSLYGVAFANGGDGSSHARIELKAANASSMVTLMGFDLGAYPDTARGTTVNIYAIGGGSPLYTFAGNVGSVSPNIPTHFAVNVAAAGGLWIEWQNSAYNVGIDNVDYAVGAVPEPETWAMMGLGLAVLGVAARRRRAK